MGKLYLSESRARETNYPRSCMFKRSEKPFKLSTRMYSHIQWKVKESSSNNNYNNIIRYSNKIKTQQPSIHPQIERWHNLVFNSLLLTFSDDKIY